MVELKDVPPGSDCEKCGHPFDEHLLYTRDPMTGGWMECPVDDCACLSTWDVKM